MFQGTVKKFMEDKGFGFIVPDDGGEDVFIHIKQCSGGSPLHEGDRVSYESQISRQTGKMTGNNCVVIAAAAVKGPDPVPIKFGIRGDGLMQLRHETGSKTAKKWRNFKPDMENEFWQVFGGCNVDYNLNADYENKISDVATTVSNGPIFDILCVGLGMHHLLVAGQEWGPPGWQVTPCYPEGLDQELEELALAIKSKSNGSLVFVGGPHAFWSLPQIWDNYMARARNTLRKSGVQVVPVETADAALESMSLCSDGLHFANSETAKESFAKAWTSWLYAAGVDPSFGRAIEDEPAPTQWPTGTGVRERSRSPKHSWASAPPPQHMWGKGDAKGKDNWGKGASKGKFW